MAVPALMLVSACQGDHLSRPSLIDPLVLYWSLELSHHAVTLSTAAPYDTLMLRATPRNQAGDALSDLPAPEYRSTDPEHVQVTAGGMLVAAKPTNNPVAVIATLTTDNLKHADTTIVRVVDATSPVLDAFSIHPIPPDSAKHASNDGFTTYVFSYLLNRLVHASDTTGLAFNVVSVDFDAVDFLPSPVPIADLLVAFRSSDTTIAAITHSNVSGMHIYTLTGRQPGTVTLYATTTALGVSKVDSVPFRIGYPLIGGISILDSLGSPFQHPTVKIGRGGIVRWILGLDVTVTFADPTNVGPAIAASSFIPSVACTTFSIGVPCTDAGNITLPAEPTFRFTSRTFPVPGIYDYVATVGGKEFPGKIVVVDDQ